MKKILVIHYSQTKQLTRILNSLCEPFTDSADCLIKFTEIVPKTKYPFPWSYNEFFSVFSDSVLGKSEEFSLTSDINEYDWDLIILGYQIWFLSPSIPFNSFLNSEFAKHLLNGKKVITVIGARNMWAMAQDIVKDKLTSIGADLIGNIVLCDRAGNFTSLVTIFRWLILGRQEKTGFLPRSGVSESEISGASIYGKIIKKHLDSTELSVSDLQSEFVKNNAVEVLPHLINIEKNGKRIFLLWAHLMNNAKKKNNKIYQLTLLLFKIYLPLILILIAPFVTLFLHLKFLLFPKMKLKIISRYSKT